MKWISLKKQDESIKYKSLLGFCNIQKNCLLNNEQLNKLKGGDTGEYSEGSDIAYG